MTQLKAEIKQNKWSTSKVKAPKVSRSLLKTIYFALFDSHLRCGAQVWGQGSNNVVDMIERTQNKAIQIISFKDRTEPSDPLYVNHKYRNYKISLH